MIVLLLTIFTSLYLFIGILFFGRKLPAYSHRRDSISELGERGSAFEEEVGYILFLPVGLLLLSASSLLYLRGFEHDLQKDVCGLMACVGTGYLVAAFFPCDPGSPALGSPRQHIHNLGGFVEYAGGAYFIFKASENIPFLSTIGFLVAACTVFITFSTFWRGLVQCVAETGLFGTIIYLSIFLLTS